MPNQPLVGVWIDLKKAVIVELKGENHKIYTIESEIETREKDKGDHDHSGRFGLQHVHDEKHKNNKLAQDTRKYLKKVTQNLKNHYQIVIFGPAQTKHQLHKEIEKHHEFDNTPVSEESADHMTDNQIVAWVKAYFSAI